MATRLKYQDLRSHTDRINAILKDMGITSFHLNYGEAYESSAYVGIDDNDPSLEVQSSYQGKMRRKIHEGDRKSCNAFLDGFGQALYLINKDGRENGQNRNNS